MGGVRLYGGMGLKNLRLRHASLAHSLGICEGVYGCTVQVVGSLNLRLSCVSINNNCFNSGPGTPACGRCISAVCSDLLRRKVSISGVGIVIRPKGTVITSPFDFLSRVVSAGGVNSSRVVMASNSHGSISPFFLGGSCFGSFVEGRRRGIFVSSRVIMKYDYLRCSGLFALRGRPLLGINSEVLCRGINTCAVALSPLFVQFFPEICLGALGNCRVVERR